LSPREQVHSEFLYGHNMFSPETHRKIASACDWEATKKGAEQVRNENVLIFPTILSKTAPVRQRKIPGLCRCAQSTACTAALDEMSKEIGGYNIYNIYDQCKLAGDNVKIDEVS
jgi:hypothetical protein